MDEVDLKLRNLTCNAGVEVQQGARRASPESGQARTDHAGIRPELRRDDRGLEGRSVW